MSFELTDDIFKNLYLAQETAKEYQEMSLYSFLFEAVDDEEKQKIANKNSDVAKKTDGFFKKAFEGIMKMIKSVKDAIADFFARFTMNSTDKIAFEELKKAVASDPELKGKKVTVHDFRQIQAGYDELIKEMENKIREVKRDETTNIDGLMKKATDFLKNATGGALATVGTDLALNMAEGNKNLAKTLRIILNTQEDAMKVLEKNLGEKDSKKFKKRVNQYGKEFSLRACFVRLIKGKQGTLTKTFDSCVKATTESLKKFKPKLWGRLAKNPNLEPVTDVVKSVGKEAVKAGATVGKEMVADKTKRKVKKAEEKIKKSTNDAVYGKDSVNPDSSMLDFFTGKTKAQREKEREQKKKERLEKKATKEQKTEE